MLLAFTNALFLAGNLNQEKSSTMTGKEVESDESPDLWLSAVGLSRHPCHLQYVT